ncbi:MAG: UDP-N-acetylmuramate dehydrogenase [Prevotellaceae bacterium]|nr:UDP-N-acetylmuramate dehydrogenase [Prevotellaceae bacterium]
MILQQNISLLPHNTFGMNVFASQWGEYHSEDDLRQFFARINCRTTAVLPIGQGSNLLFTKNFEGIILHSQMRKLHIVDETADYCLLRVESGVVWDDFCGLTVNMGLYGAENLSLIPGEVGAAAVQNIGAYGVEVKDLIMQVETIDRLSGATHIFSQVDCDYGYRHSIFKGSLKDRYIITAVVFRLSKTPCLRLDYGDLWQRAGKNPTASDVRRAVITIRRSKLPDPALWGNAGSFFKNPVIELAHFETLVHTYPDLPHFFADDNHVKIPAAWLIERCALKGKRIGGAAVYEHQPLVIVNCGDATPNDVVELSQLIRERVAAKFRIDLVPEVCFI